MGKSTQDYKCQTSLSSWSLWTLALDPRLKYPEDVCDCTCLQVTNRFHWIKPVSLVVFMSLNARVRKNIAFIQSSFIFTLQTRQKLSLTTETERTHSICQILSCARLTFGCDDDFGSLRLNLAKSHSFQRFKHFSYVQQFWQV